MSLTATNSYLLNLDDAQSTINTNNTSFSDAFNCSWCSYAVTKSVDCTKAIANVFKVAMQNLLRCIAEPTTNTDALATVFRKINNHVLALVEKIRHIPGYFDSFRKSLGNTINCIDFLQTATSIHYFFSKQFLKDSKAFVAARVGILIADVGGAVLWLRSMGFSVFSKTAETVGNFRVFGFVPKVISVIPGLRNIEAVKNCAQAIGNLRIFSPLAKIPLGFVVTRALALGYTFFAIDAFKRMINKESATCEKRQAAIEFARFVGEVLLDALILAGVTSIVGLGVAGGTVAGLALGTILHKMYYTKELTAAQQGQKKVVEPAKPQEIEMQVLGVKA